MDAPPAIKFSRMKQTHPRLNLGRLRMLHALYRGGAHLLGDDAVMDVVFGKIGDESDNVYVERKRRAFYENLFAMVVNQISAGLAQDPCRLSQDESGSDDAEVSEPDEFWVEFMENATARDEDGSEERTFDQVMRDICVEALVCGWSWIQVDLPKPNPDLEPNSAKEEEDSGNLRAYIATWPTDAITDWEETAGILLWVRTYECISRSLTPDAPRFPNAGGSRIHRWTIWTDQGWQRYEIIEDRDHPLSAVNDETEVPLGEAGTHTFGRIPWIRFDLVTPGTYLHVGDLIESLCRVYFNRTNGESWQWTQNCFQQLYEFLAPEIAGIDSEVSQAQQDPSRARRQRRAPGVVHERGQDDDARYVAPNMSGADIGKQATADLRDAVLRVTAQMALAQDTSGAMLRRSADSKKQDTVAQEIVMGAVGKRLLTAANQVVKLCTIGRGDDMDDAPALDGYASFDIDDASTLISDTVLLDSVSIPSATYQVEQKFRVCAAHLGDNADPETLAKIRKELQSAITQDALEEALNPPAPIIPPPQDFVGGGPGKPPGGAPPSDDGSPFAPKGGTKLKPTPPPIQGKAPPFPKGKSDDGPRRDGPAPGHQEKPWSCGPASLVNVCDALGIDVSEKRVRELCDADKDGTDEHQLLEAAEELDLRVKIIHTGDADASWNQLVKNAIAGRPSVICTQNWDHWVAIIGVVGDKVILQDSANTEDNVEQNGVHVLTKDQLIKIWKCKGAEKSFYAISFERAA